MFIIFAAKGLLRVIIIKKCNIYIYILYSIYLLRVEIYFILFLIKTYANYSVSFHIFLDEIGMLLALHKNIHPCVDECAGSRKLETDTFLIRNRVLKIYLSLRSARKIN